MDRIDSITLLLSQRACTNSDTGHRLLVCLKIQLIESNICQPINIHVQSLLKSHLKEMTKTCVFLFTKYFPIRVQLIQNNLNTILCYQQH